MGCWFTSLMWSWSAAKCNISVTSPSHLFHISRFSVVFFLYGCEWTPPFASPCCFGADAVNVMHVVWVLERTNMFKHPVCWQPLPKLWKVSFAKANSESQRLVYPLSDLLPKIISFGVTCLLPLTPVMLYILIHYCRQYSLHIGLLLLWWFLSFNWHSSYAVLINANLRTLLILFALLTLPLHSQYSSFIRCP